MRKTLIKGLVIVLEVSLDVVADLIKKRRKRNGALGQLDRGPLGRRDDDDRPVRMAHPLPARHQVK